MLERGVLFSGPSVRAILAGRKTQTRRLCRKAWSPIDQAWAGAVHPAKVSGWVAWFPGTQADLAAFTQIAYDRGFPCPYGAPGDRLWIRETWGVAEGRCVHQATDGFENLTPAEGAVVLDDHRWRSLIFLPKYLARPDRLELQAVQVERLQALTEEDAVAEGVPATFEADLADFVARRPIPPPTHRLGFKHGWNALHPKAPGRWADDPWVWVLTFRRVA